MGRNNKNTLSRKDKVIIFRDNVKYKYNRYLHKKNYKKKNSMVML